MSGYRFISPLSDRARLILLEREVGISISFFFSFLFFTYAFISQTHAVTVLLTPKIEQGFETQESDHQNTALRQRGVAASCRSMEHLSLTHQSG